MAWSVSLKRVLGVVVPALAVGAGGSAMAAVVCTGPGYPPGCVVTEPAPARVYGRPVAAPGGPVLTPGVGYGAPGAGVRPAAGPGVGPNAGGPVNRAGYR